MAIELNPITSGYSTGLINDNFETLEEELNNNFLRRDGVVLGEPNQMEASLDMNSFSIINVSTDVTQAGSLISVEDGDSRYVNVTGDTMEGSLNMSAYPLVVRIAENGNEPARKDELDTTITNYQSADANLQSQISGGTPLEASAFSEISWHGQVVENSVTVPDNKNAWSFGPVMSIASGQTVTVPSGSTWTVAEGSEPGEVGSVTANAPLVQSGTATDPIIDLPNATPTVAGAMSSSDKSKLDGIESGATADQTAAEIKTAYESNADTNAFTDAEQTKLAGIESGATADQTAAEIKTAYESNANTNAYTDSEKALVGQLETETAWAAPTLQNGWTNFGGGYQTARYMRDETGTVYVEGLINGGTITTGTVLFNLPLGFRPAATLRLGLIDASADTCGVNVETNGDVTAQSVSNNTFVSIHMIFKAS